ncbi:MAG: PDZ domain-containing protein [Bryobacterales bacterium]|nr:PDZ domain-containing protein [Bryobacterales bacterium]MBV9396561.1 PDZ domain-containing protein [Bryobacterales bacterium]
MNRRFQVAVVGFSAGIVGLLLFGAEYGRSAPPDGPYTHLGVYSEVLSHIQTQYVEDPDIKAVTLGAINGMLEALDPFASYLNADQYKQYMAAKQSPKADVGLVLSKRAGYMTVVDAIPGSPAAKAGLASYDVIESINNVATRDMPLAFAEILLQGEPGTSLEMSVLRSTKPDPQKVVLVRTKVDYPPVASRLVTDQGSEPQGLIATTTLDAARVREISQDVVNLEKQGAKRIVLDVRHCSTGAPEEGIALANLFMDKGLIGYTQGQKVSRQDFQASPSKQVTKRPLVVLTDRATADACEVAAAALLDSKRAQVVGERTFGDAAIRKAVTMDDGSAVILSVAKYYSPSGKAIQDTGVAPSVPQAESEAQAEDDNVAPDLQDAAPVKQGPDLILKKGLDLPPEQ